MRTDITSVLVEEHKLILRMIALLEHNSELTCQGRYRNWKFYRDAIDFIRSYADRFHHAKEEDILFEFLIANGMPREHSPVAAMLMEHDQGRAYVKEMEAAVTRAENGDESAYVILRENASGYAELLREHISKEDDILYPLAERLLPEDIRPALLDRYRSAEVQCAADATENYRRLVAAYESELPKL